MFKAKLPVAIVSAASLLLALPGAALATTTGATGATGVSGSTGASGPHTPSGSGFVEAKLKLEQALSVRQGQLTKLTGEVNAAVNLGTSDKTTLSSRLSTETANIAALIVKVPGDTTWAQLHTDTAAMYKDNRVFAVMTPQVYDSIRANNEMAMVTSMQSNESTMSAQITARAADGGFHGAMSDFSSYVKLLADTSTMAVKVDATVMAQSPAGYPHNLHVFDQASDQLGQGGTWLGHASEDGTAISLFVAAYPLP